MSEFIAFLDDHSGSLTFIVTAVYVVATILICWANIKSAKATKEQVDETRRQYEEEHRPYITYEMIFKNRTWYGMRFTNHGKRVARNVKIQFSREFLNSISKSSFFERLNMFQEQEFTLGVEQSYEYFFGDREFRDNPNKKPIEGEIIYQDVQTAYREPFWINWEKYATFYSVNSPMDDFHSDMKKLTQELKNITQTLQNHQSNDRNMSSDGK